MTDIVERLSGEADLCRNDGADDIAELLDQARAEIERLRAQCETLAGEMSKIAPIRVHDGPDYIEVYFSDGQAHRTQAMTMNPRDWQDLNEAFAACRTDYPEKK